LGKIDEAVFYCMQSVQRSPHQLDGYINCAQLLTRLNRCKEAHDWLEEARRVFTLKTDAQSRNSDLSIIN